MSSPQIEDGYTRIANELLDEILRFPFSKRELKVVLAVIRKTYGYHKKEDDMSLSQLESVTRLNRGHISETVNALADKKVLLKREGEYGQVIGINKKYAEWKVFPKREQCSQNGNSSVPKTGTKVFPKREPQKKTPKENLKRDIGHFENFWSVYPKKVKKKTSGEIWKRKGLDVKADTLIADVKARTKWDRRWIDGFIPDPTTYLNQERWEDEMKSGEKTNSEDDIFAGAI